MRALAGIAVGMVLIAAREGVAAADGPKPPTFTAVAREVRVSVCVLDDHGEPVLDLRREDFKVEEDGKAQAITFFSGERKPLRIVLALDVSLSMNGKMDEVAAALSHFIDLLEPADEILVITFGDEVFVNGDFTSDREQLERVFARLEPSRGTAIFDAAAEGIRRLAAGPAESKAVVLVTDGVDTTSQATLADVRELALQHEVPVFSIGIGGGDAAPIQVRPQRPTRPPGGGWPPSGGWPGGPPHPFQIWPTIIGPGGGGSGPGPGGQNPGVWIPAQADLDEGPLLKLADATGGRAVILKDAKRTPGKPDRLKAAAESIAMTLRYRYLVGYDAPDGGKRGWRKIRVEVDRPSVKIQARRGYYASR
jgi:VWFA-related protein